MAGIVGAKEGEACGAEDNDTCGVSLYKASPPPTPATVGEMGDTTSWGWGGR